METLKIITLAMLIPVGLLLSNPAAGQPEATQTRTVAAQLGWVIQR